ncbi:hypothetical protein BCR32DRAFT_325522 [Anaeromyces robustus]|uniref:G-patch domain-containing protein n=1 Tax=Anaeromyces robustus TaxID=1754192 RepID=A0A1Y1XHM9_9FUNG|nr:hypothetical protein BCR32DRAFT_325522 [Anaeromyces robustus]|eukprot:ORX85247.1 hypothetical protein BCR32DRAFT_325522 [Anaeromyces robustus]
MTVNIPEKKHIHGIPHILSNKKLTNNGNQAEFHLKEDNVGYKLLVKQGWDEQSGLGSNEDGRLYPLRINYKHDKKGIGIKEKSNITPQQLKDAKLLAANKAEKLHNKLNYENKYSLLLPSNNNKDSYKGDTISREEYSILSNMHREFESDVPNPSPTVSQLRKHQRIVETLELAKIKGINIPSNSHTVQGKTLNKTIQKPRINKKKDVRNKIKKEEYSRLKLLEYLKH